MGENASTRNLLNITPPFNDAHNLARIHIVHSFRCQLRGGGFDFICTGYGCGFPDGWQIFNPMFRIAIVVDNTGVGLKVWVWVC